MDKLWIVEIKIANKWYFYETCESKKDANKKAAGWRARDTHQHKYRVRKFVAVKED